MHTAGSSEPGVVSSANTGSGVGSGNNTCCGPARGRATQGGSETGAGWGVGGGLEGVGGESLGDFRASLERSKACF